MGRRGGSARPCEKLDIVAAQQATTCGDRVARRLHPTRPCCTAAPQPHLRLHVVASDDVAHRAQRGHQHAGGLVPASGSKGGSTGDQQLVQSHTKQRQYGSTAALSCATPPCHMGSPHSAAQQGSWQGQPTHSSSSTRRRHTPLLMTSCGRARRWQQQQQPLARMP